MERQPRLALAVFQLVGGLVVAGGRFMHRKFDADEILTGRPSDMLGTSV